MANYFKVKVRFDQEYELVVKADSLEEAKSNALLHDRWLEEDSNTQEVYTTDIVKMVEEV